MNKKLFLSLIIVLSGLTSKNSLQAQDVIAYRGNNPTHYLISELIVATSESAGNLADVDSVKLFNSWTASELVLFKKSIKNSWTDFLNQTENNILKTVDMSEVSLTYHETDYLTMGFISAFRNCTSLTKVLLPKTAPNMSVSFYDTFWECTMLKSIENLDCFTSVHEFSGVFGLCHNLETVRLATVPNNNTVSFEYAFYGCTKLRNIENLESYTNITNLLASFADCTSLESIQLGTDPNSIENCHGTFNDVNAACLKILPATTVDIPQVWKNTGYTNFVLPLTIDDIAQPATIYGGDYLQLEVPNISQDYAARTDTVWQLAADSEFLVDVAKITTETTISSAKNNYYLRCGVTSPNGNTYWSRNKVQIKVLYGTSTDIPNTTDANNYIIYPNPAIDYIHVTGKDITKVQIYTTNGRLLHTQQQRAANEIQINIATYPKDTYVLHTTSTNGKTVTKTFVKK